jgi:hypothetical protein
MGETDAVPVKAEPSMMLVIGTLSVVVVEAWAMFTMVPLERLAALLPSPP